jgi:hypothetical protein
VRAEELRGAGEGEREEELRSLGEGREEELRELLDERRGAWGGGGMRGRRK